MAPSVLVIGSHDAPAVQAIARLSTGSIVVPDTVSAMATISRAGLDGIVVVTEPGSEASLAGLFRVARLQHGRLALFVVGTPTNQTGFTSLRVRMIDASISPAEIAARVRAGLAENGAWPLDEPTLFEVRVRPLLEGALGPGAGAALLASLFVRELTGRLEVEGGAAVGSLYFLRGEPAAMDHPNGDVGLAAQMIDAGLVLPSAMPRAPVSRSLVAELSHQRVVEPSAMLAFLQRLVRDRVLALILQTEGSFTFTEDHAFLESRTLTKVNALGLMLEARRRRMDPMEIVRAHDALVPRYVLPRVGLGRAASRLLAFTRNADLAASINGACTVGDVLADTGLDALMGTLLLLTLEDAHLLAFADQPARDAPLPTHPNAIPLVDADPFDFEGPTDPDGTDNPQELSRLYLSLAALTDPHLVLGVEPGAGADAVRSAYDKGVAMVDAAAPVAETKPAALARAGVLKKKLERARVALVPSDLGEAGSTEGRRYELLQRLGKGGMAEVFLGRQIGMEGFAKKIVLKRILPEFVTNTVFVDMFIEEARVAARISHPNVVQIFDLGRSSTDLYIVMEYVDGADLNTALQSLKKSNLTFPFEICARIVADVAAGLHAAHTWTDDSGKQVPIIHRDVSPHNVLLSRQGHVKLADFGIAKPADSPFVTAAGIYKGKMSFLSPEYIRGMPADARSDVFAAGIVLFIMLTNTHPFTSGNIADILDVILRGEMPSVRAVRPDVPPALAAITAKAMAREPVDRYQSARELQAALEGFLVETGRPVMTAQLAEWVERALTDRPDPNAARMEATRVFLETT